MNHEGAEDSPAKQASDWPSLQPQNEELNRRDLHRLGRTQCDYRRSLSPGFTPNVGHDALGHYGDTERQLSQVMGQGRPALYIAAICEQVEPSISEGVNGYEESHWMDLPMERFLTQRTADDPVVWYARTQGGERARDPNLVYPKGSRAEFDEEWNRSSDEVPFSEIEQALRGEEA